MGGRRVLGRCVNGYRAGGSVPWWKERVEVEGGVSGLSVWKAAHLATALEGPAWGIQGPITIITEILQNDSVANWT